MLVKLRGHLQGVTTGNGTVEYPRSHREGAAIAGGAFRFKIVDGNLKADDGANDLVVLGSSLGQANPPTLTLIVVPSARGKSFALDVLPVPNAPSQGADVVDVNLPPTDVGVVLPAQEVKSLDDAKSGALAARDAADAAAAAANAVANSVKDQLSATNQSLNLVLSANNVMRYTTDAARNAANPPNGTWGWAADANNYRHRENGTWVSYDPVIVPGPVDTGVY